LGWCAQALGDLEAAESFLQRGLAQPSIYMRLERPRSLAGLALVRLAQGQPDEALALVEEARAVAETRGMAHVRPLLDLSAGHVHAARDDADAALAALRRSVEGAERMGMRPIARNAHAAMARAYEAAGRAAEAEGERRLAQAATEEIAALFTDEALRAAYVAEASKSGAMTTAG
jgi:tetratricopeptide (TPR) repeat protein